MWSQSQSSIHSSESDAVDCNLKETELTLGLPGTKRSFSDTVDLHLATSLNKSKLPTPKEQVVGWPPVRASRKNAMKSCKFVKVAVDGAPYLRKVDLELYDSNHLMNERKLMESRNGIEYMPTYEDKDGDWMLVGDVPWKMFVESCKRIRLMISSEAIGLGPRSSSKCSGST
ncbi:hypothetical protein V8G54_025740 [Vigna mungo]|uniref:Auxin-induced protein n=1 Tax=Vigna mungo TaxID=3915 RepID=A0AAQ3RPU6_VIGMU